MRKLFLVSAFVLVSVSAQAGGSRGLLLAANDTPEAVAAVPAAPQAVQAQSGSVQAQPTQAQPQAQVAPGQPQTAQADAPKPHAAKPVKKAHAHHWESDEAKARRIASHYGIYW